MPSKAAKNATKGAGETSKLRALRAAARNTDRAAPMTARQVAELCGVGLKTVHNWATEGLINHFRTPGRHLRFRAGEVVDFLKSCGYDGLEGSVPVGRVLVVAGGESASGLKRALRGASASFVEEPRLGLIQAGRDEPDVIVVDSKSLKKVEASAYLSALAEGVPTATVVWMGRASSCVSPERMLIARDPQAVREALRSL